MLKLYNRFLLTELSERMSSERLSSGSSSSDISNDPSDDISDIDIWTPILTLGNNGV